MFVCLFVCILTNFKPIDRLIIIDFHRSNKTNDEPILVKSDSVEIVEKYTYLGVVFDENLAWTGIIKNLLY